MMKSGSLRGVAIASLAVNLLLFQALKGREHYAEAVQDLEVRTADYVATIAELQAEAEAARVELAVLNVLDSHRLRVAPDVRRDVAMTVIDAAHRYQLSPELILAVIFTESSFNPVAESEVGAMGLMQLMPATALQMAEELEIEWKGQQLLTDPQINILLGSFYLRKLIHRFEDLDTALAAYNVGPNRLREIMRERGRAPSTYSRRVNQVTEVLRREFF